jgi:hypothetical protein
MKPVASALALAHRPGALKPLVIATQLAIGSVLLLPALVHAQAQPAAADVARELKALKDRIAELEKKVDAQGNVTPGMTPEQQQDFNRIAVKTEALEDSRDMSGFKGLKISGYMDPTFIASQRQHRNGFQFLNSVADGGYSFDNSYIGMALVDLTKETDSGSRWRLTLAPQRSTQAVSEGSASMLHEASVSIPLTDLQTRFIAGHIPDWSGYEYLPATQTKTITHNLLFDLTLPTAYTGAGLELTRDKWIVKGVLANMNASKRSAGEKTPVIAYRVDYAKGEFQGFGFAGVHGRAANNAEVTSDVTSDVVDGSGTVIGTTVTGTETASQRDSRVDLFEFDAYFIRGDFTAQGQISWGRQAKASVTPDPVTGDLRTAYWSGISGLLAYKFEPRLEGVVRADYIFNSKNGGGLLTYATADGVNGIGYSMKDADGDGSPDNTNKGVNRGALTLGLNYAFNLNTVFKCEYRYDWATGEVFENTKDGSFKKNNQLFATSVVVSF